MENKLEYSNAVENIKTALNQGKGTSVRDWNVIFDTLKGKDDVQTIKNVQDFVKKNFSLRIQDGAKGIAYYGVTGATSKSANAPMFMVVDGVVKENPKSFGYISSTPAGRLFNDRSFNRVLDRNVDPDSRKIIYNGIDNSGSFAKGVSSLNDFFSENYIMNLSGPDLNTVMSGEYSLNCWGRTELKAVMRNESIKTINGVDKQVFNDVYNTVLKTTKDEALAVSSATEAIRVSQLKSMPDVHMKVMPDPADPNKTQSVELVPANTSGSVSFVDTMFANNKIGSPSKLNEMLTQYGSELKPETRQTLQRMGAEGKSFIEKRLSTNGKSIMDLCKEDSLKIDSFTLTKDGSLKGMDGLKQTGLGNGTLQKGQMSMDMLRGKVGTKSIPVQTNPIQNSIKLPAKGMQR